VPLRAFLIIIGNPTTNQTGQNQGDSNLQQFEYRRMCAGARG